MEKGRLRKHRLELQEAAPSSRARETRGRGGSHRNPGPWRGGPTALGAGLQGGSAALLPLMARELAEGPREGAYSARADALEAGRRMQPLKRRTGGCWWCGCGAAAGDALTQTGEQPFPPAPSRAPSQQDQRKPDDQGELEFADSWSQDPKIESRKVV